MRDRDPGHLHPYARRVWSAHTNAVSFDPAVAPTILFETHRGDEGQSIEWAKGRDDHGNIVDKRAVTTYKRPGDSWHNLYVWARRCPSCKVVVETVSAACPECAAPAITVERFATWELVPASFAWHTALLCRGCHPPGSIVGFGAHARLTPEDMARVTALVRHAEQLGARAGADWDRDGVLYEPGESDLYHFEAHPPGATLAHVKAALAVKGGTLIVDHGGRRA